MINFEKFTSLETTVTPNGRSGECDQRKSFYLLGSVSSLKLGTGLPLGTVSLGGGAAAV